MDDLIEVKVNEDQAEVIVHTALVMIQELLPEALGDGEDKKGAALEIVKWANLIEDLV